MSPGPSRRFGGQSRAVNSSSIRKEVRLNPSRIYTGATSKTLLDQERFGHDPQLDATRPLTPLDLSLAPFKMEDDDEDSLMDDDESIQELGPLACQTIDEDALEDVEGMPTRAQWKSIVDTYLASLHPTKRHKSLISQEFYKMIFRTLKAPDATRLGTPQFRFWARKMFQLVEAPNNILVVTNGGRPVAIKEHIYDILCMCHFECAHGGRDKTCKVLREYYTWVPKELISNFVKACPTCAPRKVVHSKSRDQKLEVAFVRLKEDPPPPPRYSVERLQDFGQLPSPLPDESRQLKLRSPIRPSSNFLPVSENPERSSGPAGPYFSTFRSNVPLPPWSGNAPVTLPPLNSSVAHEDEETSNDTSEGSRCLSLPPLMQYLSQSHEQNGNVAYPTENQPNLASHIPIDPALLEASSRCNNSCPSCTSPHCSGCEVASDQEPGNALHLQLRPSTEQFSPHQHAQLSENNSLGQSANAESCSPAVIWQFPSVASVYGGDSDNSALLSASTVSFGLPTPSASGQISPARSGYVTPLHYCQPETQSTFTCIMQDVVLTMNSSGEHIVDPKATLGLLHPRSPPLLSPQPIKMENTNALLEVTEAASMNEGDDD